MNNDLNNYKLLIRNYGGQRQWNMFKMLIEKNVNQNSISGKNILS